MKIKKAAKYADSSDRTVRRWLKCGLRHSRLPSGTVLIRVKDLDQFLEGFSVANDEVDRVVSEIEKELIERRIGHDR